MLGIFCLGRKPYRVVQRKSKISTEGGQFVYIQAISIFFGLVCWALREQLWGVPTNKHNTMAVDEHTSIV